MGWLDDANALLSEEDEQETPSAFGGLSSDWRTRAKALLTQETAPAPTKAAVPDWRSKVSSFLAQQEQGPLGPEVDVVQQAGRVNVSGRRMPSQAPAGSTPLEQTVIAQSPPIQGWRGIRPDVATEDVPKPPAITYEKPEPPPLEPAKAQLRGRAAAGQLMFERIKDLGITGLKGAISVPEAGLGLLDLIEGGEASKLAAKVGFEPGKAKDILSSYYSDPQKEAFLKVQEAIGPIDTAIAALSNSSVIGHSLLESAPLMLAGGVAGKGAQLLGAAPAVAGAIGEGVAGAGSAAAAIQQASPDGTMSAYQRGLALASGTGTAAIGIFGGKLAQRLGIEDIDTMLVAGAAHPVARQGLVRQLVMGAVAGGKEGFLEEFPQSIQEQILQNLATGRPPEEGVDNAAVMGLLTGAVMGGGAQLLSGSGAMQPPFELTPSGETTAPPPAAPPAGPSVAELEAQGQRRLDFAPPPPGLTANRMPALEGQPAAEAPPTLTPNRLPAIEGQPVETRPPVPVTPKPSEPVAPPVPPDVVEQQPPVQPAPPEEPPPPPPPPPENIAEVPSDEIVRRIKAAREARRIARGEAPRAPVPAPEPAPAAAPEPAPELRPSRWPTMEGQPVEAKPAPTTPPDDGSTPKRPRHMPNRDEQGRIESRPMRDIDGGPIVPQVKAPTKSFKAEITDGSGYASNALRFATEDEAKRYAQNLMSRWMGAKDFRVVESDDPVGHRWDPDLGGVVNLARVKPTAPVTAKADFELRPSPRETAAAEAPAEAPPVTRAELETAGQRRLDFEKPTAPVTPKGGKPAGQKRIELPNEKGEVFFDPEDFERGTYNEQTKQYENEGILARASSSAALQEGRVRTPIEIGGKLYTNTGGIVGRDATLRPLVPAADWTGPTTTYPEARAAARKRGERFSYEGIVVTHRGKTYVMGPESGVLRAINRGAAPLAPKRPPQFGDKRPAPQVRHEIGEHGDKTTEALEDDLAEYEGVDLSKLPKHEQQDVADLTREVKMRQAHSIIQGIRSLTDAELAREQEVYREHTAEDDTQAADIKDYLQQLDAEDARRSSERQGQKGLDFEERKPTVPPKTPREAMLRGQAREILEAATHVDAAATTGPQRGLGWQELKTEQRDRALRGLEDGSYRVKSIEKKGDEFYINFTNNVGKDQRYRFRVPAGFRGGEKPTIEETTEKEKPKAPVKPKQSIAMRVYNAFNSREALRNLLDKAKNAAMVRSAIASALGMKAEDLVDHTREYEDAIESALANELAQDYANENVSIDQSLFSQITHALKLEALLPNAYRTIEKKKLQQFSTPLPIAVAAAYAARVTEKDRVLEPTAGTGNLIAAIPNRDRITALEIDPHRAELLAEQGYGSATPTDYLRHEFPPAKSSHAPSVIITNPPWGKYTTGKYGTAPGGLGFDANDVAERFIAKNLRDLQDGGRLVAIMPTTMLDKGSVGFRMMLTNGQYSVRAVIQSPPKAYDSRGTGVDSLLLVVDKVTKAGPWPQVVKPKDWQAYAAAVEAIHERGTRTPAQAPAGRDRGGVSGGRRPGDAEPGGDTGVSPERPADVVAGKRDTTAGAPARGGEAAGERAGDGAPAAGDTAGAEGERAEAGRPLTEQEAKRKAAIDKLKAIGAKRTKAQLASDTDPSAGSGELGFAQEATEDEDDGALLAMVEALRTYLDEGLTEFRKAILAFERDFGDGWKAFKEELEIAWDTLKGQVAGMDEARPVDDVLNEKVQERIRRSEFWRPYERRTELEGAEHPKAIIEAKQLAGVPYPKITIPVPKAIARAAREGWVSVEQAEQAVAALQANTAGKKPHGYLIADAVGVGKSREVALVVNAMQQEAIDNKRSQRLLVVTKSRQNITDLLENFPYVNSGASADGIDLNTGKKGDTKGSVPYEIVDLREWKDAKKDTADKKYKPLPQYKNVIYVTDAYNLAAYYHSLAAVGLHGIVGDEAHIFKNKLADRGKVWRGLHAQIFKDIPRAEQRFVYSTATPTQDVAGYEYLYGLRMWPIDGFGDWLALITGQLDAKGAKEVIDNAEKGAKNPDALQPPVLGGKKSIAQKAGEAIKNALGGAGGRGATNDAALRSLTAAEMEQIPRELKMLGRMSARDLWREGTEFEIHKAKLADHHRKKRDDFSELARDIFDAVEQFGKQNKIAGNTSLFRAGSMIQFAAKRIALEPAMEEALNVADDYAKRGYQPVIRVLNVSAVGDVKDETEDAALSAEDLEALKDVPLGGHLAAAINQINTRDIEQDDQGNIQDNGDIPEAIRAKGELMERAREFALRSPVDMLEAKFGKANVAIKIGGTNKAMELAQREFQQGRRKVMLISSAGATGINLDHRVLTEPPKGHVGEWAKGRRIFINAQFDWSATEEIQAIGRVDRASSITPPLVKPITFGNAAENRFLSVVANRMASLGATSRGGSQATGSAAGLEEFEIAGSDTLAAMRDAWRELPDSVKDLFWGSKYRDPNSKGLTSVSTLPDTVKLEDIQRALLYVPIEQANAFWKKVLERRDRIREVLNTGADARTQAFSGELLQAVNLQENLALYRLKNDAGHKFGLLVGVIMPEMPRIAPMLPLTPSGTPQRRYISFDAGGGVNLTGLEIPWMRIPRLAAEFGKDFGSQVLDTADKVREALAGGERVPLVQRNSKNGKRWVLRQSKGHIRIDHASWADKDLLTNNGGWYQAVGDFWYVKPDRFEAFIERFPAEHPAKLAIEQNAAAGEEGEAPYGTQKPTLPPPPAVKPKAPVNAKQQSESGVIATLMNRLQLPYRVGGYRARRGNLILHGIYKIKPEIVRTRLANDLPIIAHEIGHHLDKVYGFAVPRWASELIPVGANTSGPKMTRKQKMMEGVAEFVRLWLTEPLEAARQAPNFYAHFEQTIAGQDKAALLEAQQQIRGIVASDEVTRLKMRIDMAGTNEKTDGRGYLKRIYEKVFDDMGRLEDAVADMGTPEHVLQDAHKLADMARGAASVAEGFIEHGVKGRNGQFLTGGLSEILKPIGKRTNDFVAYLVALRAKELADRGKETGFTTAMIDATIAEYENVPGFDEARDKLYDFQDATLTYLYEHGIINGEGLRAMRAMGKYYVPFQRVMDGYSQQLPVGRSGRQLANRQSPLKHLRGSTRDVINPLESIIRNVYAATDVVMQNNAAVAMVAQAERTEGSGKWLDRVTPPMVAHIFNLERLEKTIRDLLAQNGVNMPASVDFNEVVKVWMPQTFADGNKGYITVLRDGKRYFYSINDIPLYNALTQLGPKAANPLLQLFGAPAALLRATATALNVTFGTRNPVRDSYVAWVQSNYGFVLGYDTLRGMYRSIYGAIKGDAEYKAFMTSGVMQAAIVGNDRRRLQRQVRKLAGTKGQDYLTWAVDLVRTPIDFLRAYAEWGEQGTRYGAFLRQLEQQRKIGIPEPEAQARATLTSRRSTIDFSVGGSWVRPLNVLRAFLQARIGGYRQMAQSARANPTGFVLKASTISLLSAALWWLHKADDKYDERPDWEKKMFWHLPAPWTDSGFILIPKPFELGDIFGTAVEIALDHAFKNDPAAVESRMKQAFGSNSKVDGPLGIVGDIVMGILPTAAVPVIEVMSNYDRFRDRAIVSPWDEGIENELKYTRWTTESAKELAGYLHIAPVQLEHLIYGYTGGTGRGALQLADYGAAVAGLAPGKPDTPLMRLPLLSAFYREGLDESAASIQLLYRRAEQAQDYGRSIRKFEALGETAKADALEAKHADLLDEATDLNRGIEELKEWRQDMDDVLADVTLSPKQKRAELDKIYRGMVNTAREALGRPELQTERPSVMDRLRGLSTR